MELRSKYHIEFCLLFYSSLRGGDVFEEIKGICEFTLNNFATFQSIFMANAFKPFSRVYMSYEVFISVISLCCQFLVVGWNIIHLPPLGIFIFVLHHTYYYLKSASIVLLPIFFLILSGAISSTKLANCSVLLKKDTTSVLAFVFRRKF